MIAQTTNWRIPHAVIRMAVIYHMVLNVEKEFTDFIDLVVKNMFDNLDKGFFH